MKYVKKTNHIQALQITDHIVFSDLKNITGDIPFELISAYDKWVLLIGGGSLETGDWLVKDENGLRAYSDEQFKDRYEAQE